MQSMIKREVSLSITAHSEFIRQMILDGLEVAIHRQEKSRMIPEDRLQCSAIYYRNMRQNGHSSALRTVYASDAFNDIEVASVFLDGTQRLNFLSTATNKSRLDNWLFTENTIKNTPQILSGRTIDIVVLNDYISTDRIKEGWEIVQKMFMVSSRIKLVVFLG